MQQITNFKLNFCAQVQYFKNAGISQNAEIVLSKIEKVKKNLCQEFLLYIKINFNLSQITIIKS